MTEKESPKKSLIARLEEEGDVAAAEDNVVFIPRDLRGHWS